MSVTSPRPSLVPRSRPARVPASFAQKRLWLVDRLKGGSSEYNLPEVMRLRGPVRVEALKYALDAVVARHESLRTHFAEIDGEPVQEVAQRLSIACPLEDLTLLRPSSQEARVREAVRQETTEPFDLAHGPLLRMRLVKLADEDYLLLRTFHHILSDGWSQGVFNREFMALYNAHCERRDIILPPLPVQYADFTLWERECVDAGLIDDGRAYWRTQLDGVPDELALPADRPRASVRTHDGIAHRAVIAPSIVAKLKELSRQSGTTLYMSLMAVFGVLLSLVSGQDDIVVGTPAANRQERKLQDLIGFFVNTLVIRMRIRRTSRFRDVLSHVRQTALDAQRYQNVPFEQVVNDLAPARTHGRSPIVQVSFVGQPAPVHQSLGGINVEHVGWPAYGNIQIRFDLEVHAWERDGAIEMHWLYNRELFGQWRIEQMAQQYERLIAAVAEDRDAVVGRIDLMTPEERSKLLAGANRAAKPCQQNQTVYELFERQAVLKPSATAIICGDSSIDYASLKDKIGSIVQHLQGEGVRPGDRVGVLMERSLMLPAVLLATYKARAPHVVLDPAWPDARLDSMLLEMQPAVVVTDISLRGRVPGGVRVVCLDASANMEESLPEILPHNRGQEASPHERDLAYITYTSGSTGRPKGVAIEHGALAYYVGAVSVALGVASSSRYLHTASFAFSASIRQMLVPLCSGGTMILAPSTVRTAVALLELIEASRAETLDVVPSMLESLVQYLEASQRGQSPVQMQSVRTVVLASELLPQDLVRRWRALGSLARVLNMYGHTEMAGIVACNPVADGDWASSNGVEHVGRPIAGREVYVCDEELMPVPVGITGHIYVGGSGMARGYTGQPDVTADVFVPHPFGEQGGRLYRTGDLGYFLPDGNLMCLGRLDHQIKVNGCRVDIGEVEVALMGHAKIAEAAVTAYSNAHRAANIVAVVVPRDAITADQVKAYLKDRLPSYMIPRHVVIATSLPRTTSGKLDRGRLRDSALESLEQGHGRDVSVPRTPQSNAEEVICRLVADILGVPNTGLDSNFFELGGDSIDAVRLVSRALGAGLVITPADVYKYQTLDGIAAAARVSETPAPSQDGDATSLSPGAMAPLSAEEIDAIDREQALLDGPM